MMLELLRWGAASDCGDCGSQESAEDFTGSGRETTPEPDAELGPTTAVVCS